MRIFHFPFSIFHFGRRQFVSALLLATALCPTLNSAAQFTIPVVDLDSRDKHHVVVDREKDQYLGHPTTVLLEDGVTMLTVYPKGHGKGGIVYKRSNDGGKTWSDRLPTPKSWATSREVPTLHRVVDARGVKRIIMWSGLYPARLAVTEDDGATWSELEPVGDWGGIVVMGCVVELTDKPGHYMAMFHDDGRFFEKEGKRGKPTLFTLYKTFSEDGGLTWSFPEEVYKSTEVHLCEPGAVRSPDGKQIAVLLRENARVKNSHVIFTNDEGRTWSAPRELPASLTGDRHTGSYGPDGRLFISFRDRSPKSWTSPTAGDWVGWVGTYDDIVQGKEGQYRIRLKDNTKGADTAYPGVEILPDGTLVTTTYGHWDEGEAPYIRTVRFTLEDIDAYAAEGAAIFERNETNGFRIPALVTAKNGDLLAFCERRVGLADHAQNDIVLRRSTDNGATWGPLQLIHDAGGDSLNDPSAIIVDNGEILLMYQQFPEGYHSITHGHMTMCDLGYDGPRNHRTLLRRSSDHGATWSEASDITRSVRRPEAVNIASPGCGIQLERGKHKGRLLYPVYENHSTAEKRIWKTSALISDDKGVTWRPGSMVPPDDAKKFGNENQVVELKDGSILMSSRNQGGEAFRLLTLSHDGGETWEPYRFAEDLVTPACMASVIRRGDLLVHTLPNTTKGRKDGAIFVSRDEGKTWTRVHTITPGGFAYSSLARLADGTVACLYEAAGYNTIRFARIPDAVFADQ